MWSPPGNRDMVCAMSFWRALTVVLLIWAAIFLPGLGSTEIKGEEGRRIMPAVEMIERGDWIVPHFHGEPYLRKPPLVNWLIALSIQARGVRDEWSARWPSVLAVLALVTVSFCAVSRACGHTTGALASILMMTNLGMIEKGRLAEIEAIYISLSGIAMVLWLAWWLAQKPAWLLWTVPGLFLGLALLAKGPVHLLFFYALVVPVLWRARELKRLWHPAHFAGLAVMIGIFALWAVPYFREVAHLNAAGVWAKQMEERVGGGDFRVGSWLANFPRSLSNYIPWVIFLPFLWSRRALSTLHERERAVVEGARGPLVLCFFGLMLIPGMLPRYTLPMLAPASLLVALVMEPRFGVRAWRWALSAGVTVGLAMCLYAVAIVPRVNAAANVRPLGAKVNAAVPAGEPLYVVDPGLAPFLFYVRARCVFVRELRDLPAVGGILLTREKGLARLEKSGRETRLLAPFTDDDRNRFFILELLAKE